MSEARRHEKLSIAGSGSVGKSSVVCAARADLNHVLLTAIEMGGCLSSADVDS